MIDRSSSLTDICFAVSTALDEVGIVAVLCGGSAAAIYAPAAYQSRDADFVIAFASDLAAGEGVMRDLGYLQTRGMYVHPNNPFTVEFPAGPLGIGNDLISSWTTLTRGSQRLHIVSATDCVRDRLSHFFYWSDFTALNAAVAVASTNKEQIDLAAIHTRVKREDPASLNKFAEFDRRLNAAYTGHSEP